MTTNPHMESKINALVKQGVSYSELVYMLQQKDVERVEIEARLEARIAELEEENERLLGIYQLIFAGAYGNREYCIDCATISKTCAIVLQRALDEGKTWETWEDDESDDEAALGGNDESH